MKNQNDPDPDGMEKSGDTPNTPAHGKPVTRRDFVGVVAKLIALGALSHFALLAGSFAGANNDWCRYGTQKEGDKCEPKNGNEDVCLDGSNENDECPNGVQSEDRCTSGKESQDVCVDDGSLGNGGDWCYGGGSVTGGEEQDKCADDGTGDECHPEGYGDGGGHDNCKEDEKDVCSGIPGSWSDDTCIDGGGGWWPGSGKEGKDWCLGNALYACDTCHDGTDKQDYCWGPDIAPDEGREDVCFSAKTDHCNGWGRRDDSDRCRTGLAKNDDDLCPPGKQDDVCFDHVEGSDECRLGRESDDRDNKGGSR